MDDEVGAVFCSYAQIVFLYCNGSVVLQGEDLFRLCRETNSIPTMSLLNQLLS